MARILIVDDDPDIGNLLEDALSRRGHTAMRAYSGSEALLLLKDPASRPDLMLLDLMLPGVSGEEVLAGCPDLPVIVISARGAVEDKVELLTSGARDYVTKPFSIAELMARVEVHLRSVPGRPPSALVHGDLRYDLGTRTLSAGGCSVHLTPTENALARLLLENPRQVMTKTALLDALACEDLDGTESSLKMHVSNLRRKIKAACGRDCIESVWGIGFRLRPVTAESGR